MNKIIIFLVKQFCEKMFSYKNNVFVLLPYLIGKAEFLSHQEDFDIKGKIYLYKTKIKNFLNLY